MLKGAGEIAIEVIDSYDNENEGYYTIGKDTNSIKITKSTKLKTDLTGIDYQSFWESIKVTTLESNGGLYYKTLDQLTSNAQTNTITLNNATANPYATILQFFATTKTKKFLKTKLGQYDLKLLDQIRDVILHKKGNETLVLSGTSLDASNNGSTELKNMFDDLTIAQANKLGGMLLKTYDSDIFNNWVKTDWIDGAGGITEMGIGFVRIQLSAQVLLITVGSRFAVVEQIVCLGR